MGRCTLAVVDFNGIARRCLKPIPLAVVLGLCAVAPAARADDLRAAISDRAGDFATKGGEIVLPEGRHRIRAPLFVDRSHAGPGRSDVTRVRSAGPGPTIVSGAKSYSTRPIGADEPLPAGLEQHPTLRVIDADDDIRMLWAKGGEKQIGCGAASVLSLFINGERLRCARWPDQGYARSERINSDRPDSPVFSVPPDKMTDWIGQRGLSVSGYFGFDWFYETAPAVLTSNGALAPQALKQNYLLLPPVRYAVSGAPADLDSPGEFLSDYEGGRIFLRLHNQAQSSASVEVPIAQHLLIVDGAEGLSIDNIWFEMSWGDAVLIRRSSDIALRDGALTHVGRTGIRIEGGEGVRVDRFRISDIGGTGVSVTGGDRRNLRSSGHRVTRSVIRQTSVIHRTYHPAVSLNGVGNALTDSLISDLPHIAIQFSGNDHVISGNEITRVVQETSDAGAIYAGRDWTWRGTRIEGNYLHDIVPMSSWDRVRGPGGERHPMEVKGVYLDDLLSGTAVVGNVFSNVQQSIFIGGGRDNLVSRNFFAGIRGPAVHLDARGLGGWAEAVADPQGTLQSRLAAVPFNSALWAARYPELPGILEADPGAPIGNRIEGNVMLGGDGIRIHQKATRHVLLEDNVSDDWPDGTGIRADDMIREAIGARSSAEDHWTAVLDRIERNRGVWIGLD